MSDESLVGISEKEASNLLLALARAWEARDCSAIQRLSERLPESHAFAIFAPSKGSPCFSIVSAASFAFEVPEGYTYIPEHQLLVSSVPVKEQDGDQSVIEEAGSDGCNADLAPDTEGLGDKNPNKGGA